MSQKGRNSSTSDRRTFLQGVYEENLRVTGKLTTPPPARPRKGREKLFSARLIVMIACVFVLGAALVIQGISMGEYAPDGPNQELPITEAAPVFTPEPLERRSLYAPVVDGPYDPTVAELYGLSVRTIVIDPGHGGRDPGAVGQSGTLEKDITLDVAQRLMRRLERYDELNILLTRNEDSRVTNRQRVRFANEHHADLFISIHVNWIPSEEVTPVETFYFGMNADARTMRMAERHNHDSEYSMAEFRRMVQDLSTTMKLEESRTLAQSVQTSMIENMRGLNEHVADWGVRTAPFVVLLGVEAPSILAEIAAISNAEEEKRLNSDEYREHLTTFLEEGIVNYLRQDIITTEKTEGVAQHAR